MRILFVTNQVISEENQVANPSVMLQKKGLEKIGVVVDLFHINTNQFGFTAYPKSIKPIWRQWSENNYDFLHVQFGGIQALICSIISKRKTIITFHGTDLHGGYPKSIKRKMLSKVNTFFSRIASLIAGITIVVSPSLLDFLPKIALKKTKILSTGVDYEVFTEMDMKNAREKLGLDFKKKIVLFSDISNSPVKRRDLAESAIDLLKKEKLDIDLLFLNQQPHDLVSIYLNAADLLLLTSEKEGSPNIVKEAIAVNLPIVSVDVGDVALRCKGINNCQIVPKNIEDIAQAITIGLKYGRKDGGRDQKKTEIEINEICKKLRDIYFSIN